MKFFVSFILLFFSLNLEAQIKVLAFSGSAREESVNKKLVKEAARIALEMGAEVTFIDLKDFPIPIYDGDLEEECGLPANVINIRHLMTASAVILIASPEYNGSVTPLLKNTIDWVSLEVKNQPRYLAFAGKKFVIMSASPSPCGGARGLEHLRQILTDLDGCVLPKQVVVPFAYTAFDEKGRLKDQCLYTELETVIKDALNQNCN